MFEATDSAPRRKVAIYIRVSTEEQKREGYGLEAQKKRLLEYVNENKTLNLETKESWVYCDNHTGSELTRPALTRLREDVKKKRFDAVLVWKIDRLSRNLQHLLKLFDEFKESDVSFISLQENIDFKGPIGNLIFQIFGAIAQFERELIKGRTMMGKLASAELGNYTGTSIPFGYEPIMNPSGKGKKLKLVPKDRKWIQQIYDWYIFDGLGDGQIANRLNELKVSKPTYKKIGDKSWERRETKTKWTPVMVTFILSDTIYRGAFLANKKDEDGNELPQDDWLFVKVPAAVTEFTYQQAQSVRKNRVHKGKQADYMLSGKMYDMTLEKPKVFTGAKRTKGGFSYRRKQFKHKDGTHEPVFEIPGLAIEEFVWGKIAEALKDPAAFINHYLSSKFTDKTKVQVIEEQLDDLREAEVNARRAMDRIEILAEQGTYSAEKAAVKIQDQQVEITNIETKIRELEDQLSFMGSLDIQIKNLKDASKQVKFRLHKLGRKEKKIICDLFIETIEMHRKRVTENGKKTWQVRPEVFLRFNPEEFQVAAEVGRTTASQKKAKKQSSESKNDLDGGPGWT